MSVRVVAVVVVAGAPSGASPSDDATAAVAAAFDRHPAVGSVLITGPRRYRPGRAPGGRAKFLTSASPADLAARIDADIVLLHNASDPHPNSAAIDAMITAVAAGVDAAIPVIPMPDTVKIVDADGFVIGVEDRDGLRVWQWPWALRPGRLARDGGSWVDWTSGAGLPAGAVLVSVAERAPASLPGAHAMIVR